MAQLTLLADSDQLVYLSIGGVCKFDLVYKLLLISRDSSSEDSPESGVDSVHCHFVQPKHLLELVDEVCH